MMWLKERAGDHVSASTIQPGADIEEVTMNENDENL